VGSVSQELSKEGHKVRGPSILARYNPPWTLGPLRTNELLVPITPAGWVPPPAPVS
jgi:hypothetical protein